MDVGALFEPFRVKSLELPNRIVMSPMTRGFSPRGNPGADVAAYYRRRAEGGTGLVITEGTVVERPASKSKESVPNFFGDAIEGWRGVVEAVHAGGGRVAPQLWHVGGVTDERAPEWAPERRDSPSGRTMEGLDIGPPMSDEDIADTIAAFARSAQAAEGIGCDAVELHGGHGYLLDQFFWHETNRRTDRWGGATIRERARFAAEIVRACRAATRPDFPILVRLSQWKIGAYEALVVQDPDELSAWVEPLADAGVDMFHCSQRRFWDAEFAGSDLNLAGWVKKLTGKPTITVGSVGLEQDFFEPAQGTQGRPGSLAGLLERLERGEFDLVAVGRASLGDPAWAQKVHERRFDEIQPFGPGALARLE